LLKLALGQAEELLPALRARAEVEEPGSADAWYLLIRALASCGHRNEAGNACRQALRVLAREHGTPVPRDQAAKLRTALRDRS
jgi:DNA-binding SARP family transcriptional activator